MISSVIARLGSNSTNVESLINEITSRGGLEVGELIDGRLLPITIDASNGQDMEATTRWLQELNGIDFVDVVFVHFEEEDSAV